MQRLLGAWLVCWFTVQTIFAQSPTSGGALSFQAAGSVVIRHQPELNPFPLTVTAWVRTGPNNTSFGLVNKYLAGAFCGWQVYLLDGNVRAWYFADITNNVWDGGNGLLGSYVADARWHHVAFVVDASGGYIYVDGNLSASQGWNGTPTRTAGTQDVHIGAYPGAGFSYYRGSMDEVTIWNVALSGARIRELYRRSLRGDEEGLIAYYRFDEADGLLIHDSSPAGGYNVGIINRLINRVASTLPLDTPVATNGLPVIRSSRGNFEVEAGTPVTLTVQDPEGSWNHRWFRDGLELPAETNAAVVINEVSAGNAGRYTVLSSSGTQSATSLPATMRVLTAPRFVALPAGEMADVGSTFTLAPVVVGGRPMNFQWLRDGVPVGGSNTQSFAPFQPSEAGDYRMIASNGFGAVTTAVVRVRASTRSMTNSLVLHLGFDGNFSDQSGRGNHAAYAHSGPGSAPTPTFVTGRIGQAFQYSTASDGTRFEYATLGYPPDLQLGADDDFTLSMWVNCSNQTGDLPFLSDKDWDKSHKPGWAFTMQGNGTFRFNASGPNRGRDFFTMAPVTSVRNGQWHHLLVSFQRTDGSREAWVYLYADGVLVGKIASALYGSIETRTLPFAYASPRTSPQTAWAINIGQDGTGVYFDKGGASAINAKIDDLGIWRRALSAEEARAIYLAGLDGLDFSKAAVAPKLFLIPGDDSLRLAWSGDAANRLESASGFAGDWATVPGAANTNAITVPLGDGSAFFRLAR